MMGLICGGVVLIVPLFALVKASGTAKDVDDLKQKVHRLQGRLNEMSDQFADTESVPGPLGQAERPPETKPKESEIKQAALAKPEPKHFTLPSDFKESRECGAWPKREDSRSEAGVGSSADHSVTQDGSLIVEPAAKPSEPAKPEKVAATAQAGMPRLPKVDAQSIEMKLGTYWFVRIGVMLLLTGLGVLAYYNKNFFFELTPQAKVSVFYLLSAAMGGVGFWLQRNKENLKNYGQVLLAGGFAGVYFTTYAAHVIEPVKIIDNATTALLLLFAWGGFMVWVADRLKSETIALFAIGASYYATYVPLIHSGGTDDVSHWVILFSNLVLAVAAVVFMLRNRWLKMPVLSLSASYGGFLLWRLSVVVEPSLTIVVACSLCRSGWFTRRRFSSRAAGRSATASAPCS